MTRRHGPDGWSRCLMLILAGGAGLQSAEAQGGSRNVEEVRAGFEQMARPGGYWAASNAAYAATGSGEPDEYRMAFTLAPDGNSISGCMWGNPATAGASPFWYFFHGWDPTTGTVLAYQSSPSGAVAIGHEVAWPEGRTESVQTLHLPGGQEQRVRHLNHAVHPDTLASQSFDPSSGAESGWEPRRSYRWVWRVTTEATPC